MHKFSLHVDIFKHWLENFELITFDTDSEDFEDIRSLLNKLVKPETIDNEEIEQLYSLSLENAHWQKNDFIKFQAKKIVNFINSDILENVNKESL